MATNFEDSYLRSNTIQKYLQKGDLSIFKDYTFIKCMKQLAANYYYKYNEIMSKVGYNYDDMYNICMFFGFSFTGTNCQYKDDKEKYKLMINYVKQRLNNYIKLSQVKFSTDESIYVTDTIEEVSDEQCINLNLTVSNDYLKDQVDKIKFKINTLEQKIIDELLTDNQIKKFKKQILKQEQTLYFFEKKLYKRSIIKKVYNEIFFKELNTNIDKYKDTLCHLATLKYTSKPIRKMARRYCNKYNIDYVTWVKNKINNNPEYSDSYTW